MVRFRVFIKHCAILRLRAARVSGGADRRWRSLRRAAETPTEAAAETTSAVWQKRLTEPAGETMPAPTDKPKGFGVTDTLYNQNTKCFPKLFIVHC